MNLIQELSEHTKSKPQPQPQKFQRIKLNLNESEFILVLPLSEADDLISKIQEIENLSEESLLDFVNNNNLTIEKE